MSEEVLVTEVPAEELAAPVQETEQPVVSESAPDDAPAPVPEAAPKPDRAEKRIARLTWEANEARREAERLRSELERKTQEAAPKPVDTGKPKEEDFTTAAEYVEAITDWKYEQRQKQEREERQKEEQTRSQSELQKTVQQRLDEYRKAQPDFDEVLADAAFNTSPLMAHELQESELGPAILYHFAHHPAEANRIAELTDPRKVAKEVAKIEVRLSSAPAAVKPAPTTTPPPLKPVAASRQAVADIGKIDDDAEYFRQLRASRK